MHKLNRPIPPLCLNQFSHGRDNWGDVMPDNKAEIWRRIDDMQQKRCAYCEIDIRTDRGNNNAHIEHFRQRNNYPQGTFQWANIFGSCNRQDSCGKHKDGLSEYNHQDLIKLDTEDPEQFLAFFLMAMSFQLKVWHRKTNIERQRLFGFLILTELFAKFVKPW